MRAINLKLPFFYAGLASLVLLPLPAQAENIATLGILNCNVSIETQETNWVVEFDETLPVATIDESDLPADYSASHIQIRLAQNGPVLTIGRVTGRILATDNGGKSIGSGRCTPVTLI